MKTAGDAARAKHAAVQAGYYKDPFVQPFAPPVPRPIQVIIKRGTFARVMCVQRAVQSFIELVKEGSSAEDEKAPGGVPQIVCLGSGKDTSFFRLLHQGSLANSNVRWFEIDQDEMLREKVSVIKNNAKIFHSKVERQQPGVYQLTADDETSPWPATCHLVSHDLREDTRVLIDDALVPLGLERTCPTLVIMECVQMYLPVDAVDSILASFLSSSLSDCHFCTYEPILRDDSFGSVMERNLTKARLILPDACLVQRRTTAAVLQAMQRAGAKRTVGCDMLHAYDDVMTPAQRATASKCEFLDELEEWTLIMRHYCLLVASNNECSAVGRELCSVGEGSLIGFQPSHSECLENSS